MAISLKNFVAFTIFSNKEREIFIGEYHKIHIPLGVTNFFLKVKKVVAHRNVHVYYSKSKISK